MHALHMQEHRTPDSQSGMGTTIFKQKNIIILIYWFYSNCYYIGVAGTISITAVSIAVTAVLP